MTEEDAKVKIVIPWLRQRGVRLDELTFETTFRVQVGRRAVEINSARQRTSDAISGRLDVLVARGGRNLVLVEVKQPGDELTDGDRDQAISYARLVHPIAPLALVTNGSVYRLFDTVTKDEVAQDTQIRDGRGVNLPSAARDEALEIFLGLSPANLLAFCESQAAEQLRPLTGSVADLSKVYVPELHVDRREFHEHVEKFLRDNQKSAFVVLAESGAGKTSSMCHLVRELLRGGQPVLFFRGLTIGGRLLDAVAEEFEWTFGDDQRTFELVRRVGAISSHDPLLIAVDAIEEWEFGERVADMVSVLRHLRGRSCKLLLSCKTANWDAFVHRKGTATGIAEYVFVSGTSDSESQPGYVLPPMSDTEFHWAVMNYRTVFNFHGVFEQNAISEARRNPYLLRVFFDAARDHKLQNLALTSRELLDHYYDRLLVRTGNRERAEATLLGVAGVISRANQPYIRRDVLRDELNFGVNDSFMPELFEQNLLSVEHGYDARGPKIGFYSEPLRNYLIAYRVLDLPSMPDADFCRLALRSVGMEADAFAYYFPQSPATQQRAVVGPAYVMFEQYLQRYRAIIDAHFARLRPSFEPRVEGPIGIVAELMLPTRHVGYFGFRAIRPGDADVLFIPVRSFSPSAEFLFAHGVNQARMNSSIERGIPSSISEAVGQHEIRPQLLHIVARGELDESAAPELSRELLRGVIAANPNIFSDFVDSYTRQLKYPISFSAIESAVHRASLYEHFDYVRCEDQRRAGRVSGTRNGQFVSYSWQPSAEDRAWIEQHVSETLRTGSDPEHLLASVNSQYLLERVRTAIQNLGGGSGSLGAPRFRVAGGLPLWHACDRLRMDPAVLGQAFADFYKAYLDSYQEVISASFPTLKGALPLYSKLPVRVLVAVSHPHHWEQRSYPVLIAICPPQKGQDTNEVMAIDPAQISYDANHQPLFNGEPLEYFRFTSSHIGSELRAYPPFLPDLLRVSDPILRHKVYGTIESEIDSILTALSRLSETSVKKG
jgi:hypothetical protein